MRYGSSSTRYNRIMPENTPAYFADAAAWREWLTANHQRVSEIWVLHYKVNSRKPGLRYQEALTEVLRFGWIDGKLKKVDKDAFMLRYSPRRPNSVWSRQNKEKVEELAERGLMTAAGLAAVETAKKNGNWEKAYTDRVAVDMPADFETALNANEQACRNFSRFAMSARNMYVRWVNQAKTPARRARRIAVVVARAAAGLKPGVESEQ
jgi:uncharacterized protein YdeI (YjbR/CyaY-like superfamily)